MRGPVVERRWLAAVVLTFVVLATMVPSAGARASGGTGDRTAATPATARSNNVSTGPASTPSFSSYQWQALPLSPNFPQVESSGIASDPVDHALVMFGGCFGPGSCDGGSNQTWLDSNGTWVELHPSLAPSARVDAVMAWDPADGYVLLFGGQSQQGSLNDTWAFKTGNWTPVIPSGASPPPSDQGSLAYDPSDHAMVLWGGTNCDEGCGTWTYAGGSWTHLFLSPRPSFRWDEGFAEDAADDGAVLFGGTDANQSVLGDTWLFSHDAWREINTSELPPARIDPAMTWDPSLDAVVLHGGSPCAEACAGLNDTWMFQNDSWTPWAGTSAAVPSHAVGFADDPTTGVLVLIAPCSQTPCPNDTAWGFGPPYAVTLSVEAGECASFTLAGAPVASGGNEVLLNGTYPLHIEACPGFQFANVTASARLIANVTSQNVTAWSGSLVVQGAGSVLANLTRVISNPAPTGLAAISVLGLTFLELLLIGVAFVAMLGIFLGLRRVSRRRAPPPKP
jgi:Galactose oxidase, central domain